MITIFQGIPSPRVQSGGFNVGDTNQDLILNPGETWQFTATETVTQAEFDNRNGSGIPTGRSHFDARFTVRSLYDQGGPDDATSSVPIVQNPHVTLAKVGSLADHGAAADNAGDVINYTIALANDGNMDLTIDGQRFLCEPPRGRHVQRLQRGDANLDGELSVGETLAIYRGPHGDPGGDRQRRRGPIPPWRSPTRPRRRPTRARPRAPPHRCRSPRART